MKRLFIMGMLLALPLASTAEPQSAARVADVHIVNPASNVGIRIGDVLTRTVSVTLPAAYHISKSALPLKGSNENGIELVEVMLDEQKSGRDVKYQLTLRYQVFVHLAQPGILQLPEETIAASGDKQAVTIRLPRWKFWLSPIASTRMPYAKNNVMPELPPTPISNTNHRHRLYAFVALLIVGLLALLYINGERAWLPFMGGPFARAYRKLKRMPTTPDRQQDACFVLREAFNQTYRNSMFTADVREFTRQHPQFSALSAEIERFFAESSASIFAGKSTETTPAFFEKLLQFGRSLRDCERGAA